MEKLFRTFILKAIFLIISLPINVVLTIPSAYYLHFRLTLSRIDSANTSKDKIANIILKLNSKKAHGYDDISIAMLKLCAPAVSKPLNLIFKKAWKFANVQPIHKNNSRQIKSNYRPISILPVYGNSLEIFFF